MGKTPGRLGLWLREELTQRGYNLEFRGQSRFAQEAGVAASIINRILHEDRGATNDVLRRIGKALGYTLGEVLELSGLATREDLALRPRDELQAMADAPYTDPHERQIWAWTDLPEDVREQVVIALRATLMHREQKSDRSDADVHPIRHRHDTG
uniref:HTH cro/C1-type domain-containing protein n=1 Tax=Nonomuraea gerenzanensis TaxID=93944 RepID=A0A1M4BL97_9ACTN|nr:hypothetical protein BN4615_P10967 [Nonomuraea gerenzanensis]